MADSEVSCLEFRRMKLAEPRRVTAAAHAHRAGCAACAAFARGVDESEHDLEQTLAVAVPDGLADRVLLHTRGRRPYWKAWALAASLFIAIAVGFSASTPRSPADNHYARAAIDHAADEPDSFVKVHHNAAEMLRTAMASAGGSLKAPLGTIRYVKLCPVESGTGWHIVFETPEGLATLLIVPGKPIAAAQSASTQGWSALARPIRTGYYAVVTPSAAMTARIERLVSERIDWRT